MRTWIFSGVLIVMVLLRASGHAQIFQVKTPVPDVTAATAFWQMSSEPFVFQGMIYFPTREFRMFDGQVMAQIGIFQGVPIYADTTLEPWSLVYVPVGRERMRVWERPRDGVLEGTTGSRVPWYPVRPSYAGPMPSSGAPLATAVPTIPATPTIGDERPVGTAGTIVRPRTTMESIPPPSRSSGNGVWLEFDGSRWYSAGAARSFTPDRFLPLGAYHGFPVYREINGPPNRIWISVVVPDGPLAPYDRR
jgi:hypothetical protein